MKLIVEIPSLSSPTGKEYIYEWLANRWTSPHKQGDYYRTKFRLMKGTLLHRYQLNRGAFIRYLKTDGLSPADRADAQVKVEVLDAVIKKLKEVKR